MAAMAAPWKALLQQSLRRNEALRHSIYFQIATVRPDGRPANRTVVYRGFLWDTDAITFVTDARSQKVADLAAQPYAEVAWYFPETREQYRLSGRVGVVTAATPGDDPLGAARAAAWRAMSDPGRQQFTWPHPGLPRATGEEDAAAFAASPPSKEDPVADPFCLCYLEVEAVDHVDLKTNRRRCFARAGGGRGGEAAPGEWTEGEVNP